MITMFCFAKASFRLSVSRDAHDDSMDGTLGQTRKADFGISTDVDAVRYQDHSMLFHVVLCNCGLSRLHIILYVTVRVRLVFSLSKRRIKLWKRFEKHKFGLVIHTDHNKLEAYRRTNYRAMRGVHCQRYNSPCTSLG